MDMSSPPPPSLHSTPFSSPNVAVLLKIKILSWSQETGFPVCVRVRIADRIFNLHKLPLTCKSGYFMEKLKDSNEVELPPNFPGGADTFEAIALFIYGSSALVDPFNVAALRCAAEFLRMTEEYGLCERFDIYLNQVVLQSWNDTLIVLQTCQSLLPWAEDLLIVSRCIETLAFMACREILDPERGRDRPVVTVEALAGLRPWSDVMVRDVIGPDLWIKDVIALPLVFFKRVIGSLRRQGMKEKYVTPILLFYAHRWVFGDGDLRKSVVLQGVLDLMPVKGSKVIPFGFYLSLLANAIELRLRVDNVEKVQNQIASLLHLAELQDFDGVELVVVERVFSSCSLDAESESNAYVVAELWDLYLNKIALDSELCCKRFIALIQTIPPSSRQNHDHLCRALNSFFKCHPNLTQEEKGLVCKHLNCQKLSQQVCIEAVQNELMPLRLMVQALFVQQLNTQQAFKDSFRCTNSNCVEFSGSLAEESPYIQNSKSLSTPLGLLLHKDSSQQRCEISVKEYESTSFRIENLEKELMSLKKSLERKNEKKMSLKKAEVSRRVRKKKNQNSVGAGMGQVSSCIGSVNFASQRKYANRIVKVLQRLTLFTRGRGRGRGKGRSNRNPQS